MRQPEPITEEELVLFYYEEFDRQEAIEAALEGSAELRRRYRELEQVLDAVRPAETPARSDLYGHEVWKRVYPRLERRSWSRFGKAAGWALAASLVIVISFWAGRESVPEVDEAVAFSAQARQRILLVSVADHLERSQFLLLELTNSDAATLDAESIESARQLKTESRLFRQAAEQSGEGDVARVLEELERFLTELTHMGPATEDDLEALFARLEDKNLLFKVRVLGTRIEERAQPPEQQALTQPTTI